MINNKNKTKTTTLGLFAVLAIGMMTTPIFAESEIPLSPYQQLKQGVPLSQIQCTEQKILVISPSEKPACLNEDSASKLEHRGWSIVTVIQEDNIITENKDTATTYTEIPKQDQQYSSAPVAWGIIPEFSHYPKLGENATVSIDFPDNLYDNLRLGLALVEAENVYLEIGSTHFGAVNFPELDKVTVRADEERLDPDGDGFRDAYVAPFFVDKHKTDSFSTTFSFNETGKIGIFAGLMYDGELFETLGRC